MSFSAGTRIAPFTYACASDPETTVASLIRPARVGIVIAAAVAVLWPGPLLAQRAVPRPPGRPVAYARPYHYPYYPYYPYYYSPYYAGYYFGFYSPFFWGPYPPYPYPYYGYWPYDNTGSARLQITPRAARVYVDGHFAGLVDDFDGTFQRLNVEAGEHEVQIHLDGYRPFTVKVLFLRGKTLKISHALEALAPGEAAPPPPQPADVERPAPSRGTSQRVEAPPPGDRAAQFGSLLLRVRPADATVVVDGEEWNAPAGEDQLVIELSEGPHRVEIRKAGFQTYATLVRVRRGETLRLNVSLTSTGASSAGF
jgi:PEGA domain-containing protein